MTPGDVPAREALNAVGLVEALLQGDDDAWLAIVGDCDLTAVTYALSRLAADLVTVANLATGDREPAHHGTVTLTYARAVALAADGAVPPSAA